MDTSQEQERALDHARQVLAEESIATAYLDAEWRRELRMALADVVKAFAEARLDGQKS